MVLKLPAGQLQFEDSELAVEIMTHFAKRGIPIYPVHDSFIIEEKYELDLIEKMKQAFEGRYKASIEVKPNR